MKVPSHLVGLYYRSVRRYRKLNSHLKKQKNPGGYAYLTLLNKLRKLARKIATLQFQLKIAAISGGVALVLSLTPARAQTTNNGPFVLQPRNLNPLREPLKFDGTTYPAVVDLDKDGDFDLVVADEGNYDYAGNIDPLRYLLNVGTNARPEYIEKSGSENPFNDIEILKRERGPVFADIDEDGDEDLFVGVWDLYNPGIYYYKNENGAFTQQTTAWDPVAKTGNPFADIDIRNYQKIAFVDLDKDSDLDAIIAGTLYDAVTGTNRFISYYKNDGEGSFSESNGDVTFTPMPTNANLNPAFADIDKDGDADLVLGGYYYGLQYYKQVTPGNFVKETEPFDPVAQTGNPFFEIYEPNTQPVFADLDNDSDLDLILGDGDGDQYYGYPAHILHLIENTGNSVFEERRDLANPLGGLDVRRHASPVLLDLDGDDDLDALIGHKYEDYFVTYNTPRYYTFENEKFIRREAESNPFIGIQVSGTITPSIVDLDADGDLDFITSTYFGELKFFRNNGGVYSEEVTDNPFSGINVGWRSGIELADVDADGDFDLILGDRYGVVHYFANIGTAQAPVFEQRIGAENPFSIVGTVNRFEGRLNLADVDHDGDLDVLASESYYVGYDQFHQISYYENGGTAAAPTFELASGQPFLPGGQNPFAPTGYSELEPYLADQDGDGDLDLFVGSNRGIITYIENENPEIVAAIAPGALSFRVGEDEAVTIDPTLTLSDADEDFIVQATVTVTNFQEGDELHFVSQGNITGTFSSSTGVLSFKGKGTLADYQAALRTITYHHHEVSGGRSRPMKQATVAKSIEFRVYDSDFTRPLVATRTVNVIFNSPPFLENTTGTTQVGFTVTVDLSGLMTDPDNNLDLGTLQIIQQPASGATAIIDANLNLIIDYDGINFAGADNLTIQVCDDLGECAQSIVTIQVESSGKIEVFNAVAPNSAGDNRFMRIHNLPAGNKVSIFSRWGDRVFQMDNYDSGVPGRRFEGMNDNGKALPSGTYFYKIEVQATAGYSGPSPVTGYIVLKQ